MTKTELRKAKAAKLAAMRAAYNASFGDYWAGSASQSVTDAYRSGNFVTVQA